MTVHDTQLASCNITKNTWHQYWCDLELVLGFPVEGRRAGLQAGVVCLLGGNRRPLSPTTDVSFSLPAPVYLRRWSSMVMGAWGSRQTIFRSKEARCSSDWRQFHLCNMQFQCWKLWEFNRALEDFNICLKIIWQVLRQQHYCLNVSEGSDKIKP